MVLFDSRTRGDAREDSDLDLVISDAATTAHWAGSRWHVLGQSHREGLPLDASQPRLRRPMEAMVARVLADHLLRQH